MVFTTVVQWSMRAAGCIASWSRRGLFSNDRLRGAAVPAPFARLCPSQASIEPSSCLPEVAKRLPHHRITSTGPPAFAAMMASSLRFTVG